MSEMDERELEKAIHQTCTQLIGIAKAQQISEEGERRDKLNQQETGLWERLAKLTFDKHPQDKKKVYRELDAKLAVFQ